MTFAAAAAKVLARPRLWGPALAQARLLVPNRWWASAPFLPLPDRRWLAFRMTTAYGSPGLQVDADDLATWLEWTGTVRGVTRSAQG